MTATTPPAAEQPALRPQPSGPAAGGVGEAALVVGTRMGSWLGVQLLLAGLVLALGTAASGDQALEAVAGWWTVYGGLVDLATLAVIVWLLGRDGGSYRGLLGPATTLWQATLGAVGVLAASVPALVFSDQLTRARYGDGPAPMFAVVELPGWAAVVSVVAVPLLAELAEPVAYLGVVLPRLERWLGRAWPAALIVVGLWAAEHALYPLLVSSAGGGLDWGFAAYRVASVLPFLAAWTGAWYALGRRLLPVMAARWILNTGTALALTLGQTP